MRRKGFTLAELMVVVAIIGVLAAVIAPQIFKQIAKGRVAATEAFYNSVKIAASSFYSDTGQWPPNTASFMASPGGALYAGWDGPYLDRWPGAGSNPWKGSYGWGISAAGTNFGLVAAGERWITVTLVPQADAQRIDRDRDGSPANGASGMVRYGPGAVVTVLFLISRDGPVS